MSAVGSLPILGPNHFLRFDARSYLYTGAHSPALKTAYQAMANAYEAKSAGPSGRDELFTIEANTRATIGALVDRPVSDVALLGDASTAWSAIANGWQWRQGDNIVANEYEHPSVYAPWLRFTDQGLQVRIAKRSNDWTLPVDSIEAQCDENTTAILISHVGYVTGLRHDLDEVGRMAERRGIPLLVDLSHSLGVVPISLRYCSLAVSASYKWILGPYGVGIAVWNRDLLPDFTPGVIGWRSVPDIFLEDRFEMMHLAPDARRFQTGAPALDAIAGLGAAAEMIQVAGVDAISEHALALSGHAQDKLTEMGLNVVTPRDDRLRAGNVAFRHKQSEKFAAKLAEQGIYVWGGDGRVRASFHVMNALRDVDLLTDAVAEISKDLTKDSEA